MTSGLRQSLFWALFAATLAVYCTMLFWSLPKIATAAGGLLPFDLRPTGYDLDAATAFLSALGDEARAFYLGPQHWLDLVYPALLAAMLAWSTLWGFREMPLAVRLMLIAPAVLGTGFDWLENARVAGLLDAADVTSDAVAAASFATVAKSAATSLAFIVVLAGLAHRGWRRWRAGG